MIEPRLPNLLYIADVPVESSYHGSALIYRLLQGYPPEQIQIVQSGNYASQPDRRLPDVQYKTLKSRYVRLLTSRFHRWYSVWLSMTSGERATEIEELLGGFRPEAVLTVAHGHLSMTAVEFARRNGLPLHLVIHDDWAAVARLPRPFRGQLERQFKCTYLAAVSRLCVSPYMVDEFARRFGVGGSVLYPSRAMHGSPFARPPERLRSGKRNIVFAFAGTINSAGYSCLVRMLSECLEAYNGQLKIFGPTTKNQASREGLGRPNIELCGPMKSAELIERLRHSVDVLFVPMSFASTDRANMKIGFPSKLADYTAIGLPILIFGPDYCSAVRWARANPGVADVVDVAAPDALGKAVGRLARDADWRLSLATRALQIGERLFSHSVVQGKFFSALTASRVAEVAINGTGQKASNLLKKA